MTHTDDARLLHEAQRLLDERGQRLTNLRLIAEAIMRDAGIVQVLVRPTRAVHSEEYIHVLAAVEAELDVDDDETVLLVPVADEAA